MIDNLETLNALIGSIVWGPPLMMLLIGTGLYLTIRLDFLQFMEPRMIWRSTVGSVFVKVRRTTDGALSSLQAASFAMAATIGVGNIAGVSTAIYLGGPGALFWMWVTAAFGMATKYSEVLLGMKYRHLNRDTGEISGGPMYYIAEGMHMKWPASAYAFFTGVAAFGIGNMVQANTIAVSLEDGFAVSSKLSGAVIVFLVAVVILGGVRRIGQIAGYLVPFMAIIYVAGGLSVLMQHLSDLPDVVAAIFAHAFTPTAPIGAWAGSTVGASIRYGIARGIFSNEAGLGTASIVHAQAKNTPAGQGLWGICEVFVDTIVVASMTGLVILVTGVLGTVDVPSSTLAAVAFEQALPGIANISSSPHSPCLRTARCSRGVTMGNGRGSICSEAESLSHTACYF